MPRLTVRATVNTESPSEIRLVPRRLFPQGSATLTGDPKELVLRGESEGATAGELNRALWTELRRVERKTRLRSEWTFEGTTGSCNSSGPVGVSGPVNVTVPRRAAP